MNGSTVFTMLQSPEGPHAGSSSTRLADSGIHPPAPGRPVRHGRGSSGKTPNSELPRRGSILSEMSLDEARGILKAKTDEVLLPTAPESTTWHSIPLAFAVAPAIAGAFLEKGESFMTDVLLLLLAGIFLHWLVKFPWYVLLTSYNFTLLTHSEGNGIKIRQWPLLNRMSLMCCGTQGTLLPT